MKKCHFTVFGISVALLLFACSGKKGFHIDVDARPFGTQEITAIYETDSKNREVKLIPAIDGKFQFSGFGAESTTLELYSAKHLLITAFEIKRGDKFKLRSVGDSIYIEGNDQPIITAYADTIISEWPRFESPELVIRNDSTNIFPPEGIWIFTSSVQQRTKSLLDTLRYYAEKNDSVRDVYISGDLSRWRSDTRRDSATWTQGLLPDAPLLFKGILNFTPCLVEVDTLGSVIRVQRLE